MYEDLAQLRRVCEGRRDLVRDHGHRGNLPLSAGVSTAAMALDLALPGSLDALLDALVSPDNGVRSAAERAYEATTAASPDALLAALLAALRRSPVQERRELAAVLLRKARSLLPPCAHLSDC